MTQIRATGITFPDGSIQTTAGAGTQGPQGPQGDQGPQGNNGNDGGSFSDVNSDGVPYIRINQSWQPLSSYDQTGTGGIGDAPADSQAYVRYNNDWQLFSNYDQNSGGGGGWSYDFSTIVSSLTNGATSSINGSQPSSGQVLKFDGSQIIWSNDNEGSGGGIGEAPYNGSAHIRINGEWQPLSSYDQTGGGSHDRRAIQDRKVRKATKDQWAEVLPMLPPTTHPMSALTKVGRKPLGSCKATPAATHSTPTKLKSPSTARTTGCLSD